MQLRVIGAEIVCARALNAPTPRQVTRSVRLGVPRQFIDGWLSQEVRQHFEGVLDTLHSEGATLVDVDIQSLESAGTAYAALRGTEAARIHRAALSTAPEAFSPAILDRLIEGQQTSLEDYVHAHRVRADLAHEIYRVFADHNLSALIVPTTPVAPPIIGSTLVDLERGSTEHRTAFVRLTVPFSLAGLPVVALPSGYCRQLPVGVQLVGLHGGDAEILALGTWFEQRCS